MFQESLQRIVDNVEGGLAGLLMGLDGIAIESYTRDRSAQSPMDIQTVGMEFSYILSQVKKAAEALEIGNVQEIAIRAEKLSVIIRMLTPEYFLALALTENGNFGKGRYMLRITAPKLQAEL